MTCPIRNNIPHTITVIDETVDWIVVDKPAHMLVHPSKPDGAFTLLHGLRELLAYEIVNGGQVSIINRLDRETSGVTLVAKNASTARSFSRRMEKRTFNKEYIAIAWGWPENDAFVVEAPLSRKGELCESRIHLKQAVVATGSDCRTRFQVLNRFERDTSNGRRFSVIRAMPETGRMHQIRLHLAHVGHPIIGDKIYGPDENYYLEFIETGWTPRLENSLLLDRHALHASKLRIDDLRLEWSAPLPLQLTRWINGGP
jgi:23S rRNA pseudouridine1911/1915/1917 synthase